MLLHSLALILLAAACCSYIRDNFFGYQRKNRRTRFPSSGCGRVYIRAHLWRLLRVSCMGLLGSAFGEKGLGRMDIGLYYHVVITHWTRLCGGVHACSCRLAVSWVISSSKIGAVGCSGELADREVRRSGFMNDAHILKQSICCLTPTHSFRRRVSVRMQGNSSRYNSDLFSMIGTVFLWWVSHIGSYAVVYACRCAVRELMFVARTSHNRLLLN